jgi:hypothetical protein
MFNDNKQPSNSVLEISAVNKALAENKELKSQVSDLKNRVSDLEGLFIAQAGDLSSLRREIAAVCKQMGFPFETTSKVPVCGKW